MNCHNIFPTQPKDVLIEDSVMYKAAIALKNHRTDPILIENKLGLSYAKPDIRPG
jgi:hypothetical protein